MNKPKKRRNDACWEMGVSVSDPYLYGGYSYGWDYEYSGMYDGECGGNLDYNFRVLKSRVSQVY